jgi:hypothetical protein
MNTKATKFLAVLALFAMAFAVVAFMPNELTDANNAGTIVDGHDTEVDTAQLCNQSAPTAQDLFAKYTVSGRTLDADGIPTYTVTVTGLKTHLNGATPTQMWGNWAGLGLIAPNTATVWKAFQVLTLAEATAKTAAEFNDATWQNTIKFNHDYPSADPTTGEHTGFCDYKSAQDYYMVFVWATADGATVADEDIVIYHVILEVTPQSDSFTLPADGTIKGVIDNGVVIAAAGTEHFVEFTGTITIGKMTFVATNFTGDITTDGTGDAMTATIDKFDEGTLELSSGDFGTQGNLTTIGAAGKVANLIIGSDATVKFTSALTFTEGDLEVKAGATAEFQAVTLTKGDFTLGDDVVIGAITITKGDFIIGSAVGSVAEPMTLANVTVTAGQLYVKANAVVTFTAISKLTGDFTVEGGAKVTVPSAFSMEGDLLVRGTLVLTDGMTLTGNGKLYGTIQCVDPSAATASLKITVDAKSAESTDAVLFKAYDGSNLIYIEVVKGTNYPGNVTIDISGATHTEYLSGTISESRAYGQTQNVVVNGPLTITSGAVVTINGSFEVLDDITVDIISGKLIVEGDGVVVIIDGTINIDEAGTVDIKDGVKSVTISGQIFDEGTLSIQAKSATIANDGSVVVSADAKKATLKNFTVAAGGTLQINGEVDLNNIINKGYIVLEGAILTDSATIAMDLAGATIELRSFSFSDDAKTLTITDASKDCGSGETQMSYSEITFTVDTKKAIVSGISIVKSTETEIIGEQELFYSTLTMSGALELTQPETDTNAAAATLKVKISNDAANKYETDVEFADEFYIGPSIEFDTKDNALSAVVIRNTMVIEGAEGKLSVFKGHVVVLGCVACNSYASMEVKDATSGDDKNISAGVFTIGVGTNAITYYASVEAAAELISESAENVTVTFYGKFNLVLESVTIPATMQIKGNGTILAGTPHHTDVVVTVSSGAAVKVAEIHVYGTLYFENKNDDRAGKILADVTSTDGTDMLYTNLYTALDNAEEGDIIEVTAHELNIVRSITVPEGVVLYIPNGIPVSIDESNKVTITVIGTLMCNGIDADFAAKADETHAALKVYGIFMDSSFVQSEVKDKIHAAVDKYVGTAGAFYYISDDIGDYVYISPLCIAAESSAKHFTISGDLVELDSFDLIGKEVTVLKDSSLTAPSIFLKESVIKVDLEGELNAGIKGLFADSGEVYFAVAGLSGGIITNEYDKASGMYETSIGKFSGHLDVISGLLCIDALDFTLDDETLTVEEGAILYIPEDAVVGIGGTAYIEGLISVAGYLIIDSENAVLTGTIGVVYDEDEGISGELYIGKMVFPSGSIIVDNGAKCTFTETFIAGVEPDDVGSDATIIGNVYTKNAIIAYPGTDMSELTINGKIPVSTEFYINGDLFMTVYSDSTSPVLVKDVIGVPEYDIEYLDYDQRQDLKEDTSMWGATDRTKIGDYESLNADVDYATVTISTSWVTHIVLYIDGERVIGTTFDLKVGLHKVSAVLDAGYACDNMKITFNGVDVPATGIIITVDEEGSLLAVTGDVYVPHEDPVTPEEKSEWTITTILLVVLVILIAIMAVIVAMRLNRS